MSTMGFIRLVKSGAWNWADYTGYNGSERAIARGWAIQVCCQSFIRGNYPDFKIRHVHCQRCGDATERKHRTYHLHHRYGEDDTSYGHLHTPEFIREHYEVLCPECHAIHHGDALLADIDIEMSLSDLKRRADGAMRALRRRMQKRNQPPPEIESDDEPATTEFKQLTLF